MTANLNKKDKDIPSPTKKMYIISSFSHSLLSHFYTKYKSHSFAILAKKIPMAMQVYYTHSVKRIGNENTKEFIDGMGEIFTLLGDKLREYNLDEKDEGEVPLDVLGDEVQRSRKPKEHLIPMLIQLMIYTVPNNNYKLFFNLKKELCLSKEEEDISKEEFTALCKVVFSINTAINEWLDMKESNISSPLVFKKIKNKKTKTKKSKAKANTRPQAEVKARSNKNKIKYSKARKNKELFFTKLRKLRETREQETEIEIKNIKEKKIEV